MPTTSSEVNATVYARRGSELRELNYKTIGTQVKLTVQNKVTQNDVQAELEAIHTKIDGLLASADAMQFKGVVNNDGDLPSTYTAGWTWKVGTAGTYKGVVCEVGDLIIAVETRDGSGNENADFAVFQGNIDGAVTGPASAVNENIAVFNQTTGRVIKDSGIKMSDLAALIAASSKVWVHTVQSLPDVMPENLFDGGLLIVDASYSG